MAEGIATEAPRLRDPSERAGARSRRWSWRQGVGAAWIVAIPVFLLYALWLFAYDGPGHDPRDAVALGRHFVQQSHASTVIKLDPAYRYPDGDIGYDGQFAYFIALDPVNARYYTDAPTYRYSRILYPLLARGLAIGQARLIPYTLLLINFVAIVGGTLLAALWLRRKGVWPWFALVYGLYPGLFLAFQRDTTEVLAYGLVALGVYLLDFGGRHRILLGAVAFSMAVLTRETTAVFPVLYGLGLVVGGLSSHDSVERRSRRTSGGLVIGVAVLPFLLYKVFLLVWLGAYGDPGLLLERVPFLGVFETEQTTGWVEGIRTVLVPGLICLATGLFVARRHPRVPEPWILVANAVLFVVLLHRSSWVDISASARVTVGVVLAAILCLPLFTRVLGSRAWFWVCGALWLSLVPFWILMPELKYLIYVSVPLRHPHL